MLGMQGLVQHAWRNRIWSSMPGWGAHACSTYLAGAAPLVPVWGAGTPGWCLMVPQGAQGTRAGCAPGCATPRWNTVRSAQHS